MAAFVVHEKTGFFDCLQQSLFAHHLFMYSGVVFSSVLIFRSGGVDSFSEMRESQAMMKLFSEMPESDFPYNASKCRSFSLRLFSTIFALSFHRMTNRRQNSGVRRNPDGRQQ
jgi:hypothetical protein